MEYREPTPSVLLLHDGELAEIADVVEPLGGIDRRGKPTELDRGRVWDVIVASASRMLDIHEHLPETSAIRIAVLDGDSKTLRKLLYRVDTDLLVRQPVHPAALRLLILHALYRGPEKRRTTRVSMGASVRFRTGFRRRTAVLTELSTRGCRLLAKRKDHRAAPNKLMTVVLPTEITNDNRPLSLRGHVMRVTSGDSDTDEIAVLFELLREAVRNRLESVVTAHSHGPATLDESVARALHSLPIVPEHGPRIDPEHEGRDSDAHPLVVDDPPEQARPMGAAETHVARAPACEDMGDAARSRVLAETAEASESFGPAENAHEIQAFDVDEASDDLEALEYDEWSEHAPPPALEFDAAEAEFERRRQERHAMSRRIIALGDEAARVLIGRDLSVGGMRIDATPGLALGDRLKVAVHVRADGQPLVVSAEITRDDGADGMALRFVDLSPAAHACLDEMVGALPNIIEPNGSNETAGVVISEVVGRRAG